MKILVTGSSGFVGSELVKLLRAAGHRVAGFNIDSGQDIRDCKAVEAAMKGIDALYHLAAVLDEHSRDLQSVNVEGTRNVLEAAARAGVRQFIFLSTTGVMGEIRSEADESAKYNPQTPYEKSKAEAEKLVLGYQEALPVTVVRSALAYGPNTYWAGILKVIKKGMPLAGSGENTWQIVYVKDLADALFFLLGKESAIGETFIVAGDEKPKLKEIYGELAAMLGVKENKKNVPAWLAKTMGRISMLSGKKSVLIPEHIDRLLRERNYSTEKIKSLGWKPKYPLEKGLREMVAELKKAGKI